MTWTLSLLLVMLCQIGEPSAFDGELGLGGRGQGRMTDLLVANAAVKARVFAWLATVEEAMGDEKAAEKARDAASDALELALTDREFAQHFLGDARNLLARSRTQPYPHRPLPGPIDRGADPRLGPDPGGSVDSLEQQRSDLRAARTPR